MVNACNLVSCFLVDPLNNKFNPFVKGAACTVAVVAAYSFSGYFVALVAVSALWRKFQQVREPNDTYELIAKTFYGIVYGEKSITEMLNDHGITLDERINLKNYTEKHCSGVNKRLFQFAGNHYYIWYSINHKSVQIQLKSSYPSDQNKLGLPIDEQGNIREVYVDQKCMKIFPKDRLMLLKTACMAVTYAMTSEKVALEAQASKSSSSVHSGPNTGFSITQQLEAEGIKRQKFRRNVGKFDGVRGLFKFNGNESYEIWFQGPTVKIQSQKMLEILWLRMNESGTYISEVYVDRKPVNSLPQDRLELLKHAYALYSN